jgi:hypothetical protein
MAKQQLTIFGISTSTISDVSSGSYSVNSIEFDSRGRITRFPTGAGFGNVVGLSGGQNRISISTGLSPVVDLAQIVTSSTYLMPTRLTIDAYGRTTSVSTASGSITSATYTGRIGPVTINANGYFSSIGVALPDATTATNTTFTTDVTFQGTATYIAGNIKEPYSIYTGASSVETHNFAVSNIWRHVSIGGNFTANFINVPTTAGFIYNVSLILSQGSTAYIPNAVQINGSAQTIRWAGASTPSGTANRLNFVSFTFINTNTSWIVLGDLVSYG